MPSTPVRIAVLLVAAFGLAALVLHRETKLRSLEASPVYVESRSQLRPLPATATTR